jgi:hypothetical protein
MKNLNKVTLIQLCFIVFALFYSGCDVFEADGGPNDLANPNRGYFYMLERTSSDIIMMDSQLRELKRWNLSTIMKDTSAQGLTFDGKYLWFAAAGSTDLIFQLDATDDTLVVKRSFAAPPEKRGTVRDIAWDGVNLWALNSGSTTYNTPPALYKLNPLDGSILYEINIPSPEPRGLTYVSTNSNIYGSGAESGIYYTDVTKKRVYFFRISRFQFDTSFTTPVPPRGMSYIWPAGLTFDGINFWLINSSGDADHLYRLTYAGAQLDIFDLPYPQPGSIVWTSVDVRKKTPPAVFMISPSAGLRGSNLIVNIYGAEFRQGVELSAGFGSGISVTSLTYISPSHIRAGITIAADAAFGKRNVTVTNPDGQFSVGDSLFEVVSLITIPHLYLIEQDLDSLYKIRIADTTIVKKWDTRGIAPGGSPQGLAFDGNDIWLCASGTDRLIMKLDTTGAQLSVVSSFPAPTPSGIIRGIVWESNYVWLTVSGLAPTGRIYKMNPSNGAVVDSINTPGVEPRAITFANGILYCNDTTIDTVFAYNATNKNWTGVFGTPIPPGGTTANRFATGMTWDGSNFWIANSTGNYDHVFRVSLSGTILMYFESPRIGLAQITGLVYTPN